MQVDVQIGQDQLLLDEIPDDAGHLVAVEFDDRIGDLDLVHGLPLKGLERWGGRGYSGASNSPSEPSPSKAQMTAPAIILSHPQMGENIGAAARAMKNFGLSDLRLIAPQCGWPNDRAQVLASGAGDIIGRRARCIATPPTALADIRLVLATTARGRDVLREILTPAEAARRLRAAAAEGLTHRHPVRRRAGRAGQ